MVSLNYQRFVLSFIYSILFRICIKKNETLPTNLAIDIYIGRIKNRLVFKIKYRYKLELQTPETMKLFGSITKLTDKTKNGENIPNFELVEVVLAQHNLVVNQHRQKPEVLYILQTINLMLIC